jgi:hypothetical protein
MLNRGAAIAASVFSELAAVVIAFQFALAAGAPWGRFTMRRRAKRGRARAVAARGCPSWHLRGRRGAHSVSKNLITHQVSTH